MKQKLFTLDEIRAAFKQLQEGVEAQGVDAACAWAIHSAAEDVLQILTGELTPGSDAPDEDELRHAVLEARTAEAFDAAVLRLVALHEREQVTRARNEIDPGWMPSPAGNEAMVAALETYAEKRAGALGRGAARSEAEVFAVMEGRRIYWRMVRG
jgi:hypothetical protein